MDAAAEEVLSLIERLHSVQPRAEIVVVAMSAGSLVAMRLLARTPLPTVLVSPPVSSLRELVAEDPASARRQMVRFYRYRDGTPDLEVATATAEEEVSAFAGDYYSRSLADLITVLPPRRRDCLAIAYGPEDGRVGVSRLAEVRSRFPSIRIAAIHGMGHAPASETEAAELARVVVDMISRHCS